MVSIVDVTGGFPEVARVGGVSWVKSQMPMSSISFLMLILEISSITFVMVKGSSKSENRGRGILK